MKLIKVILLAAFILSFSCLFASNKSEPDIMGMYSNFCYNSEGGDLLGMEVFLVYSDAYGKEDYYVYFQASEGGTYSPILVKAHVDTKKMTVEFVFPKGTEMGGAKFFGVIKKDGMQVNIKGTGYKNEWLKRQPSYWESMDRFCK